MRFNSKRLCPGTLGVDAFAFGWTGEFNWLVPPVYLIGKTTKHFCSSKTAFKTSLPVLEISYILAINRDKI